MPAWNAEKTIKESLNSVIAQTFEDWELIVINDASQDKTADIIQMAAENDPRIILLTNETNRGIAYSRNRGVAHAKGDWLAFLDSDDLWRKEKLEKQLRFMEEMGALISYTATSYMNASGEMYDYTLRAEKKLTYKALLKKNLMSCSSVMVWRDEMISFPYGELHEDYAVWLVIVRKVGYAYGLDEPLLVYRLAPGSKSSKRISSAMMTYNAYSLAGYGAGVLMTLRYALHSIGKRFKIRGSYK